MSLFEKALNSIPPVDSALLEQARRRLDQLTKPRGSLGRLEEFAQSYASHAHTCRPSAVMSRESATGHGVRS